MNSIISVVAFALLSILCFILLKTLNSDLALVLSVCSAVIVVVFVVDDLYDVVYVIYDITKTAGINSEAVSCLIKIVGIGYIAQFGNNICVDAGCKSVGDSVVLCAKISILICAIPVITQLFSLLKSMVV